MFSNLSFTTWNIHGLFNKVLGDKSKNQDFIEAITKNDFVFLTETWGNQNIHIPGFETINSKLATPLSKHACRQSGGISFLFKQQFKRYINVVINTKNFLWSKISKEALNSDKDLYICGTYIPPEKSQYYDKDIFEEFENDINQISPSSNIIILGDFNARTGKLNDALSDEGNKHVPDKSEQSHQTPERESFDLTVNNHGENL